MKACTSCACSAVATFAGADGPDRLVGARRRRPRRLLLADALEAALDLGLHDLERRAGLALGERLADAEDRAQLVLQGQSTFRFTKLVGLAEELSGARCAPGSRG
jgi:hypothetical protein